MVLKISSTQNLGALIASAALLFGCIMPLTIFAQSDDLSVVQIEKSSSMHVAQASEGNPIIQNPLKSDSIQALLAGVLRGVVRIGAIVLLMALVWVGFLFVAAQGAEEKLRAARTNLVWTVVGGVILLGAEVIAAIIEATASTL